jgi:hypothetical protein
VPKARAEGGELQLQLQRAREVGDDHEQPKTHERIRGRKGPAQLRKEGGGMRQWGQGQRPGVRGGGLQLQLQLRRAGEVGDGHANNHKRTSVLHGDGRDLREWGWIGF